MCLAFFYKETRLSLQEEQLSSIKQEIKDVKKIVALKRVWADRHLSQKIDRLQSIVPASKVKWHKRGKKLTAGYQDLTSKELNKVMTKLMNLPLQITSLNIVRKGENYMMECQCKW
jgi:hypothetical protein